MSNLPQELIEKIIDHVAEDFAVWPGENLLHCALVNRSFCPRSQFYIFSSIHIGGEPTKRRKSIEELLKTVQNRPQIAHYIESLQLDCIGHDNVWMLEDQNFTSLMEHISSRNPLQKLSIVADTDDTEFVADDFHGLKYEGPLMDNFFLPFISPFITSLSLQRLLRVPIEVVTACVNLKDLELLHVVFKERPSRALHPPFSAHFILRRLTVRRSRQALSDLLDLGWGNDGPKSSLNLSLLKSFTIYTDALQTLSIEQAVIDMSAGSLEELHVFTLLSHYYKRHLAVDLHRCKSLRSLHVHVLFPEANPKHVLRTFSTITTKSFQTFSIDIKLGTRAHYEPEAILYADWSEFCAEFNQITVWHSNLTLSIKLLYTYRRRRDGVELGDSVGVVEERCGSAIAHLREILRPLIQPPGTNLLLSYELDCI